jgi:4-diphosphocytidyl-2-C-methyl-D-erythritol kinase
MEISRALLGLPAPAKINLFLHVLGRRADGFHEIQSAFVPVALHDSIDLATREDGQVVRSGDLTGPESEDLPVRAAHALRAYSERRGGRASGALGVQIGVHKRIPVGAGLGGGSSDAATTLIGLNRLWRTGLGREQLAEVGAELGSDVPFFLGSGPAFVEGRGERCTPCSPRPAGYLIVYPQVSVSTAEIFSDPKLTRDHKHTTILGFSVQQPAPGEGFFGANDLEEVARVRFPQVDEALRLLQAFGPARMSGSGSAVFAALRDVAGARELLGRLRARLPAGWQAWAVAGQDALALAQW